MTTSDAMSKVIDKRIKAVRRRRLLEFINDFLDRGETQAAAARKLGIEPNHISQYTMKKPRGIGEGLARAMEHRAGLPPFWFDDLVTELTERERHLIHNFRNAPKQTQVGTEAILQGYSADPENHIETVILTEKKAG